MFKILTLTGTTNGSGDATINAELPTPGALLWGIEWIFGSGTSGVDFVLSDQNGTGGVAKTLFTGTNVNANATYEPRKASVDNVGAAQANYVMYTVTGTLRCVIAQGGSAKTYSLIVYLLDI